MTETDWLHSTDAMRTLEAIQDRGSPRKLRLFACACVFPVWHLVSMVDAFRRVVQTSEAYADGQASEEELRDARMTAGRVYEEMARKGLLGGRPIFHAGMAAQMTALNTLEDPMIPPWFPARQVLSELLRLERGAVPNVQPHCCALARDIFGNPFRPVAFDPAWRTPAVIAIAQAIYEQRHFEDMPTLADTLEEAGCDEQDLLNHCRVDTVHARGCWVLDLVLAKG
jgi:hypothetical protein